MVEWVCVAHVIFSIGHIIFSLAGMYFMLAVMQQVTLDKYYLKSDHTH